MAGHLVKVALLAAVAVSASGCRWPEVDWEWRYCEDDYCIEDSGSTRQQNVPFDAGFRHTLDLNQGYTYATSSVSSDVAVADLSQLTLDLSGSTFDIGPNNHIRVLAWRKGTQVGKAVFPLTEVNDQLTLSNPAAAEAWFNSLPGSTTSLSFGGSVDIPNPAPGWGVLDAKTKYQGVTLNHSSESIFVDFTTGEEPCLDEFGNIRFCFPDP